ncbi:hypothetical protein FA95DRAFT_1564320 [Auriscalpium vulgare]|uniref:Uncharacterized protein n=1 Tax=Auriscalpium vulgare TaxID=40419 RepID=A0ACB8RFR8_9AGAM|nr:hypothetical protein FA95DRAFT_1564320 [Auriscalpium vulgare]
MSSPVALKTQGNAEFRAGNYATAIELYTKALTSALPDTTLEEKRQLLSNRAQAYLKWGEIYNALYDTETALSSVYTSPSSPPSVTRKCLWRKAKVLQKLLRWEDGQRAFDEFVRMSQEGEEPLDNEALALRGSLKRSLALPADSEEKIRSQLLQALNARGICVELDDIDHFPHPRNVPYDLDEDEFEMVRFDTAHGRPDTLLADPLLTPLTFPVVFGALFVKKPTLPGPLAINTTMSESDNDPVESTIGGVCDATLTSYAMTIRSNRDIKRDILRAMPRNGGIICHATSMDRFLIIPPETTLRDLWAAARWPRPDGAPPPFEDIRTAPRDRASAEIDGALFMFGSSLNFLVVASGDRHRLVQTANADRQ